MSDPRANIAHTAEPGIAWPWSTRQHRQYTKAPLSLPWARRAMRIKVKPENHRVSSVTRHYTADKVSVELVCTCGSRKTVRVW